MVSEILLHFTLQCILSSDYLGLSLFLSLVRYSRADVVLILYNITHRSPKPTRTPRWALKPRLFVLSRVPAQSFEQNRKPKKKNFNNKNQIQFYNNNYYNGCRATSLSMSNAQRRRWFAHSDLHKTEYNWRWAQNRFRKTGQSEVRLEGGDGDCVRRPRIIHTTTTYHLFA